ncbi:putative transcription factor MYB family [Rosa chinensis]|uniref:Putative transcription factor MYB family n=1 Tax=Rosa chinensis TaxID=74649 RepID=A0A2P6R924_ROSCH|nr:trihelix transcription factor GT-3b [Rosa chinensis]PRQ42924.1 putative transcription factor MYB family [Rosa chinensis]
MEGHYPHHLHQQQQQELHQFQLQHQFQVVQQPQQLLPPPPQQHLSPPPITVHVDASDRFPQWSVQETKELITIRAGLDQTFMETKRNKQLWEVIATQMKDKGHNRSAEQCKCKWKNLVTRYKGCETAEAETMRQQFPFFNDLATIMAAREQRMVWTEADSIGGASASKKKAAAVTLSSDEEDEDNEDSEEAGEKGITAARKKKKVMKTGNIGSSTGMGLGGNNVKEILEDFMRQQLQLDMQWREEFQARENERRMREYEWRQTMEALENERLMLEREWREREEQRRMREEARAEKRDAILTALLDRLNREDM